MPSSSIQSPRESRGRSGRVAAIPFDAIRSAGTYVCNWSGHLLRVPADMAGPRARHINIVGTEPLFVTKISDDPDLPVRRARQLASDLHLRASF